MAEQTFGPSRTKTQHWIWPKQAFGPPEARPINFFNQNLLPSTVMASPGKTARNARPAGEPALLTSRDNRWLKEFRVALRGGLPTEDGFVGVEEIGRASCRERV